MSTNAILYIIFGIEIIIGFGLIYYYGRKTQ